MLLVANHISRLKKTTAAEINTLDPRSSSKKYELDEIIWTVVLMFFLRDKSRNNMNLLRKNNSVDEAFFRVFGIRIPHLDTCNVVLEKVDPEKLKVILSIITSHLIRLKLFEATRLFGRVAVSFDGTGIGPVDTDGPSFSWCSLSERAENCEKFYFSIITNISPNQTEIKNIMRLARERAIIEDGFNTLKTRGFTMKHKFSRVSDFAAMNYISLMCTADILSNIVFASDWVQRSYFALDEKYSIQALIIEMKVKLRSICLSQTLDSLKAALPAKNTYSRPAIN